MKSNSERNIQKREIGKRTARPGTRLLAMLLVVTMVLGMVPGGLFDAEEATAASRRPDIDTYSYDFTSLVANDVGSQYFANAIVDAVNPDYIWFTPAQCKSLVRVNVFTQDMKAYDVPDIFSAGLRGGAFGEDGNLYLPVLDGSGLVAKLELDPISREYVSMTPIMVGTSTYYGTTAVNEFIYFIPTAATDIKRYNIYTQEIKTYSLSAANQTRVNTLGQPIFIPDDGSNYAGTIWAAPYLSGCVARIKVDANGDVTQTDTFQLSASNMVAASVVYLQSKIWVVVGQMMYIVDPDTGTFVTKSLSVNSGTSVSFPVTDGKYIFAAPTSGNELAVIDPGDGVNDIESYAIDLSAMDLGGNIPTIRFHGSVYDSVTNSIWFAPTNAKKIVRLKRTDVMNIEIRLVDENGNPIHYPVTEYELLLEVDEGSDNIVTAPPIDGYHFVKATLENQEGVKDTITNNDGIFKIDKISQNKIVTFHYAAESGLEEYVYLDEYGETPTTTPKYSLTFPGVAGEEVEAFVPDLQYYKLYHGELDTVSIPNIDTFDGKVQMKSTRQTLELRYMSLKRTITIKAVNYLNPTGPALIEQDIEVYLNPTTMEYQFDAQSLYVNGYDLIDDESALKSVTVKADDLTYLDLDGINTITSTDFEVVFQYRTVREVVIEYEDRDNPGTIVGVYSENWDLGDSFSVDPDDPQDDKRPPKGWLLVDNPAAPFTGTVTEDPNDTTKTYQVYAHYPNNAHKGLKATHIYLDSNGSTAHSEDVLYSDQQVGTIVTVEYLPRAGYQLVSGEVAVRSVEVLPGDNPGDNEEIFTYEPIDLQDITITVNTKDQGDPGINLEPPSAQSILGVVGTLTVSAPDIIGYKAVSYQVDGGATVSGTDYTFAELTTNVEITFFYEKLGQLTIDHYLDTRLETTIKHKTEIIYQDDTTTVNVADRIENLSGYTCISAELVASDGTRTPISLTGQISLDKDKPQHLVLTYAEDKDLVKIKVEGRLSNPGQSNDGDLLYDHEITMRPEDTTPASITAFDLENLKLIKTAIGSVESPGAPATVSVSAADGDQTVTFTYEDNTIDVIVYGIDYDKDQDPATVAGAEVVQKIIVPGVEKGTLFSYPSLTIPSYQLVDSTGSFTVPYSSPTMTVGDSSYEVKFYYREVEGNLKVEYVDDVTNEVIGHKYYTMEKDVAQKIEVPAIPLYTTTELEDNYTWDGSSVINDIKLYYTRQQKTVILEAWDAVNNKKMSDATSDITYQSPQNVGAYYNYQTDAATNLLPRVQALSYGESPVATYNYYVESYEDDANTTITIKVWYTAPSDQEVTVELWIGDPNGGGERFNTYTIPAATGQTVTLLGNQIPNLETSLRLKYNAGLSQTTATQGQGNLILAYDDQRHQVLVKTYLDGSPSASIPDVTYRTHEGGYKLYPNHYQEYVFTVYDLGAGETELGANDYIQINFDDQVTNGDIVTVKLYYQKLSEVIQDRSKSITIRGVDAADGSELYSYTVNGDVGTTRWVNPLAIPNYTTADSGLSLEFGDTDRHTFVYDSDFITITIHAVDDLTGNPITDYLPQTYQAAKGRDFTAYAPALSGWVVADGSHEKTVNVMVDTTVEFCYEEADNMVLIKAIANDTGEVIKVVGKDLLDGPINIVAADELEPLTGWRLQVGESLDQTITVPDDKYVEFRYERVAEAVTVRGVVSGQPTPIFDTTVPNQLVGSQYTGVMEPVLGYQLVSGEVMSKTITVVEGGPNLIEFEYVVATGNVMVVHESAGGEILYVEYDEEEVGEIYTAYARNFAGHQAQANSVSDVVPATGLRLTIVYDFVMTDVPVYLVDDLHQPLHDYTETVPIDIPTTIYAPSLSGYVITGADRETVTASGNGTESVTFVYRSVNDLSDENYVTLTIWAKTDDGNGGEKKLYSYDVRVPKSTIQTIAIKSYLFDLDGYILDEGKNQYTVLPDIDDVIDVWYQWHRADVTIKAEMDDGSGGGSGITVPGFAPYKIEAEVGSAYTPTAPQLPGYEVSGSSLPVGTTTVHVTAGGTEVIYYYKQATGNLLVKAVDREFGTLLDSRTVELANDQTFTADQAAAATLFAGADFLDLYVLNQDGNPSSVTYNGLDDEVVVYEYDRLKSTVTLSAIDNRTGVAIGTAQVQVANLRVLESYNYVNDLTKRPGGLDEQVEQVSVGYRRIVSGTTTMLVSKTAADNVISIYYEPQADQEVPVELWAGKPGIAGSELLQSYTVPAALDEIISFADGPIPDLTAMGLVYNENDSTLAAQEGVAGDKIILVYDDNRTAVTVRFYLDGVENTARTASYKTVEASYDVTTPYIAGYLLDSYDDGRGEVFASPDTITLDTSGGDVELKLYYKNLSAVIEDRSQSILVIGEDAAGQELYRYTLTGDRGVKDTLYPIDVPNYTPTSAATAGVPVEFGMDSDVTFVYETDLATVTIRAVDSSSTAISGYAPKTYEVVKDTSFTAYAPVLDGWVIKDTGNPTDYEITQMITSDDTFTFTYQRSEGLLLVKAVDENDPANVLKVVGLERDHGIHNIDADLVLGSILGWERTDADQDKDVDFPTENEVIFQYGKQMVTITLRGEDEADPGVDLYAGLPLSQVTFTEQVGTPFTASMIPLVGYRLVDSKDLVNTITVPAGGAIIQFDYEAVNSNVYVIHEVEGTNEILSMSDKTATPGSTYTAQAIDFAGYQLDSAANTQTETVPEDGSELVIRFTYKRIDTVVTIELHDSLWNPADGGASLLDTIPQTEQIGVWATIYAPPLAGYVLDLDQVANNNGRLDIQPTGDPNQDVVAFYYKSVDDASNENYVNITMRGVTGALTHYSYVLRLPKSSDPFTLIDGTHVFNVPGYILDANQLHTITPDQDDTLTFTYTSTDGSVRIVLQDELGDPVGAGSWSEAATVNDPFTYLAPHVDGYLLVRTQPTAPPADDKSAIGYIDQVAADNSSQIVFAYRLIASPVVIYCYDDATKDIIRVVEVESPVVGNGNTVAAPDLSAEYYTTVNGQGTLVYDYNGSDSVIINAYYDKDLATIRIAGVDEDTLLEIPGTEGFLSGQRKGEVTTVNAPTTPAQYQLSDAASRLVLVDPTLDPATDPLQEELFYFKSVEETYVPVRVVDAATGEELQNYGIMATTNEVVKVDPDLIQIAGYVYDPADPNNQSKLSATAGDGTEILVMLTDIRKELTLSLVDELDGSVLGSSVERIVFGALKTIYPPYLNGYVLVGYQIDPQPGTTIIEIDETFTGVMDYATGGSGFDADHTVTFVYRQISEYIDGRARSVLVRGLDADTGEELYTYTISGDNDSAREVKPIQVPNYTAQDSAKTIVFGQDSQVEFEYTSEFTTVIIAAVDENGAAIAGYYPKTYDALIDETYTAYAPVIDGWVIQDTGSSADYEQNALVGSGGHTFTFTYVKAEGMVLVKAVEAGDPSNVLRVVGRQLSDGSHTISANDTIGSLTGWTLTGSAQMQITVPADSEVIFTYDQQDVSVTVRYLDQRDPTGQTEIRPAQTFSAQEGSQFTAAMEHVDGWQLADNEAVTKTVYATSGAEITFAYVASSANVIEVHKDQTTGAVLEIEYLELEAGAAYSASAIDFTGYQVATAAVINGNAPTDGTVEVVEFGYTSLQTDITVLLREGVKLLDSITVKGQLGVLKTIEAPHLTNYALNDDTSKAITPTLPGPNTVTFQYRSVDDVSEDNRVTITIQGVTTTTEADGASTTHVHYSYDKRVVRSSEPFALVGGADVFAVPGYVLEDGQDSKYTVYPTADDVITFDYKSTEGTVKITLQDQATSDLVGAGSFNVAATIGEAFTFPAPYVDGYMAVGVTPSSTTGSLIGTIAEVQEHTVNEILFTYEKITSAVTIICKEDNASGAVIHQEGIANPVVGGDTVAAPDLSGSDYTVIGTGQVTYAFDGTNASTVEVYYTKDLVDIELAAVDGKTGSTLRTEYLRGQRKGEAVTLQAGLVAPTGNYTLIDQPERIVIAADGLKETFRYNSLDDSSVMVRVYAGAAAPANEIYSYVIPATTGDPVTIDPATIRLAGYVLDASHSDNRYYVTAGDGIDIVVIMTDVRQNLTSHFQDEQGNQVWASTTEKLVTGTGKTIYPTYINGYVLVGYKLDNGTLPGPGATTPLVEIDETFTGILDFAGGSGYDADYTVTFVYRSMQDYVDNSFVHLTVRGQVENQSTQLYSYTQVRQQNSGVYPVDALAMVGYVLAAGETGQKDLVVQDEDLVYTFWYTPLATSVTIKAELTDGAAVPGFTDIQAAATINQPFSYSAPYIPGYNLVGNVTQNLNPVTESDRTLTFTYSQADGNVVILQKENDENGAVIRTMSDKLEVGETRTYEIADPQYDLTDDHYYPVNSQQSVTITNDGTAQTVELYYTRAISSLYRAEYDVTTGRTLIGGPTLLGDEYRVGELVTVEAIALSDPASPFELVSTTPQLVIISDDDNQTVEFEYKSIAEREVVVEAVLAGQSGEHTLLQSYTVTATEGRSVTVPAPTITGYRLDAGQADTGTAEAPGKITFVYVNDRVRIQMSLADVYGNPLAGPVGYETSYTVPRGLDHTAYAPHVSGYVIVGSQSETYHNIGQDQYPAFTYRSVDEESDLSHVDIHIKGVTGDYVHYSYVRRFEKSDDPTALREGIDLFYVNGYRLTPGQNLAVIPNQDEPEISFEYEPNTALVEIAAAYDDGTYETPIESFTTIYVEAEIGKPFTFITPDIEGFAATGNSGMLAEVTGDRTLDRITFYYKKGEGNVTIIAMEGADPIGRYHTALSVGESVDVTRGGQLEPTADRIDALQYYEPTATLGVADYDVYDGVNPVTVTFQFTKKTAPVTLIAMNTELNGEITRLTLDDQRVLEEFSFADQLGALDALVEPLLPEALRVSASTTHLVSLAASENEIHVWYVPPATSTVTVELWIDEPGLGELIQSYYLPATKNGTVSLGISQIPDLSGLGLLYDADRSTTSAVEGTGGKILLVYLDQRVEVDVYIVKDIGTPVYRTTQKAVIGSDVLVTAPYFAGYVLKSYKVSGSSSEELPNDFEGVKITGISASYNVTFYYQSLDDYLQEEYVNIIVRGLEAGARSELYSHVVTVPKADDKVTEITAFTVSGYTLEDDGLVLVATDGSQTLVEFLYRSDQTSVTIQALLESGEPVPQFSERSVPAELGQPFTYSAPYIEGYELIDRTAVIGSIEAVSETNNVLIFYYQRSTGGVTVQLIEKGAGGAQTVIASYAETVTGGVPVTIAVPDLSARYYTALDTPETITYEGQEIIVTYTYEKQTRDALLQLYDVTDPANEVLLEEFASAQRYRVGEVAAIEAPAYSGYKLISPAVQYVLIEPADSADPVQGAIVLRQEVSRSGKRAAEQIVLVGKTVLVDDLLSISGEQVATDEVTNADQTDAGDDLASLGTDQADINGDSASIDSDEPTDVDNEADDEDDDRDADSDPDQDLDGNEEGGDDDGEDPDNPPEPDDGSDGDDDDISDGDNSDDDEEDDSVEEPNQNDTEPQAIRFEYASAEENEVVVNAIEDETGKLLYSYTLTGANGETRTINAPQLAGYALAKDEDQAKRQTISGVVEFRYTQDLVVVSYLLVDENGEIINAPDWIATSYNVAKGANYTAYAPHIPGYALTGQQNQSLTNVLSPQEVTFTYRYDGSDQKRSAQVTVHYLKAEDQTTVIKTGSLDGYYVGERFLLLPSLPESFNHGGRKYQLDEALTVIEPTYLLAENDFYAYYKDNGAENTTGGGGGGGGNYTTATLTVHGVDVRTGNLIYNQSVTVVVGTMETIKAPTITGYALDAASESSQTITIESGTNLVTFNYNYTGGDVDMSGGSGTGAGGIVYLSRELLNRTDHYAYISGYPDQTVRPEDSITREEVAAIFYRILTDETRSSYFSQTNRFSDVSYGWWSNEAISTIANLGVVQGDPEGTFRPGDNITRAEMAVIVAKFSGGASTSSGDQFSDISAHWARGYINQAASVGFVNGDGGVGSAFRPDDNMSRAEVMALVNQLLDRIPPTAVNDLDGSMIQWTDNRDAGKWYYYHVQEATNSHYYEVQEDGTEKWNGLRSNRSWN